MTGPTYMKSQPNNGMFGDLNKKGFAATELERAEMSDQKKVAAIVTINHAGFLQYLFGSHTVYDTTKNPPVIKAVFGSSQNSTSVVAPISLPSKVHGYSARNNERPTSRKRLLERLTLGRRSQIIHLLHP